jgi:hypothetical protein
LRENQADVRAAGLCRLVGSPRDHKSLKRFVDKATYGAGNLSRD